MPSTRSQRSLLPQCEGKFATNRFFGPELELDIAAGTIDSRISPGLARIASDFGPAETLRRDLWFSSLDGDGEMHAQMS